MEAPGGVKDGGVSIEPWQIPKFGGESDSGRGLGQQAGGSAIGTSQGLAPTGASGAFATANWPGRMAPMWHRGFFGGAGIRSGGGA